MLTCAEVDELLPAYALRALSDEEMREVREHLATCTAHADVAALQATAMTLALGSEGREPPADLLARIQARIAAAPPASMPTSPAPPLAAPSAPIQMASKRRTPSWALGLAAAAVVVFASLGLLNAGRLGIGGSEVERVASVGAVEGHLVYRTGGTSATFDVRGVEAPPHGHDYQAWVIHPGQAPLPAGVMRFEAGTARVTIPIKIEAGDTVAVTVEPAGGSAQPTTQPFLAVQS